MRGNTLDLEGLPEPVARGLEAVAELARRMLQRQEPTRGVAPELPLWRLGAIGALSRDEIYDEYDCRC